MTNHQRPADHLTARYAAASEQWVHAEQMRWTILYNFLVGNTILLVAWSALFAALVDNAQSVGLPVVLILFCGIGIAGSIVWAYLQRRSNRFTVEFFETGLALEEQLLPEDLPPEGRGRSGPFTTRSRHQGGGGPKTHVVVVAVPAVFGAIYLVLLVVSIYAASGRL